MGLFFYIVPSDIETAEPKSRGNDCVSIGDEGANLAGHRAGGVKQ